MIRTLLFGLIVASLSSSPVFSFDKEKFVNHLRKALNEPASTKLEISDPVPSEFEGFSLIKLTLSTPRGSQVENIYLSKDEKKYWLGTIFDTSLDYDKERVKQMDLKNAYYKGWNKAPVTIVEFSDLQCGYCRKAHEALQKDLYKHYSKKQVRLVFKHFPLSSHKWALDGAMATQCAGEQSQKAFWALTDKIFEHSRTLTPDNIKTKVDEFAEDLKLNRRALKACMEKEETKKTVLSNRNEGLKVGVRSTPTFYVNGRMHRGFRTFDDFRPLIDEKLKEAGK